MKKIPLTQGYEALVDDVDYWLVMQHKWGIIDYTKKKKYAGARINGKRVRLHNFIMNPPKGLEVDHINTDTLDCRRSNMRISTHADNCRNRENPEAGVHFDRDQKNWRAGISVNYKKIYLGRYKTKEEAVEAVQLARKML